jgi:hypothetical protein
MWSGWRGTGCVDRAGWDFQVHETTLSARID